MRHSKKASVGLLILIYCFSAPARGAEAVTVECALQEGDTRPQFRQVFDIDLAASKISRRPTAFAAYGPVSASITKNTVRWTGGDPKHDHVLDRNTMVLSESHISARWTCSVATKGF